MVALAGRFGLNAERVMRETDPTQQAIDVAAIEAGVDFAKKERHELAVALNNALVRAFSQN